MQVTSSWTFEACPADQFSYIRCAGRWERMEEAAFAASLFLNQMAKETTKPYSIRVVMVEEFDPPELG